MNYKTELHCHCAAVSNCSKLRPARIAERYREAGYTTVVLTDHFSRETFSPTYYLGGTDWESKVDHFMHGYELLRDAAGADLHVLLGMEIRINRHASTDYLVYGVNEAFLRRVPDLLDLKIEQVSETLHAEGLMIFQAHPFRDRMLITNPALLDGIEVYNASTKQNSRNEVAEFWAKRYGLCGISGSDLHSEEHFIGGGILTEAPITTNEELLATLRSGRFELLRGGKPGPDPLLP